MKSRSGSVEPSPAALVRAAFKSVRIPPISKIKNPTTDVVGFLMAEDEGFEPPQTESESGVLPLHKSSMNSLIICIILKKSSLPKNIFYSQGKGSPFSSRRRNAKVFSSPSSRSMVRIYSSSLWVWGCIRFRSLLPK